MALENETTFDTQTSGSKFQDYGKKSLGPLIDLLHNYQGDITPYLSALQKGLLAASDSFTETSGPEKTVGNWFRSAHDWTQDIGRNLEGKSAKDIFGFIESQAKARPAALFATSYVAGLLFGRVGKHLIKSNSIH